MQCQYCKKDDPFPFRCAYCGEIFCAEHRIPEMHNCSKILKARAPTPNSSFYSSNPNYYSTDFGKSGRPKVSFSKSELKHIALACLLVFLVGLTFYTGLANPSTLGIAGGAVLVLSFILHELGHKIVAQRNTMWAEFRTNPLGIVLTAISIISPIFKFIAPGAVVVWGSSDENAVGRAVIIGPIINIAISLGSLIMFPFVSSLFAVEILFLAFRLNSWLALFNLLPFSILDGKKVFDWSKVKWGIAFAISMVLLVVSYLLSF